MNLRRNIGTLEQPTYKPGDPQAAFQIKVDLDKLFRAVFSLGKETPAQGVFLKVLNNSEDAMTPGLLYGRDGTTGQIAPALMGPAATAILARWLCVGFAVPGAMADVMIAGPAQIKATDGITVANYNVSAWVSATDGGRIVATPNTTAGWRRQAVGTFSTLTAKDSGAFGVDLYLQGNIGVS